MSQKQKSLLRGIGILGIAGVLCKVIGVLFRIPLAYVGTKRALDLYQLVFPTYSLFLTISSAGLPVAISRMVAHCLARNDPRNAKRVFKTALYMLMALGFATMIIVMAGSGFFARGVKAAEVQIGFVAIAPSLFIVCIMSAFRGFLQGQQNMVPTAISQLLEQLCKVLIALPLAALGYAKGGAQMAAVGALGGTSIGEGIALLYVYWQYRKNRASFQEIPQNAEETPLESKVLIRRILSVAIPITLGACIVPLASFIDSWMIPGLLVDAVGFTEEAAKDLYGTYSGVVIALINVPTAVAAAISMGLVPAVSHALSKKDDKGIRHQSAQGMRFAFLIGLPCSVGMSLLAEPIARLAFEGARNFTDAGFADAGRLLSVSALTIVLFTVVQATSGILQGMRKQRIPMYTLMAGVACKIALNYTLIQNESINIMGAPIASLVCYTVSMVPNIYFVWKHTGTRFDWMAFVVRPGIATAAMGLVVWAGKGLLPTGRITTIALVALGVAVYVAVGIAVKAITKEDIRTFTRRKSSPQGE